jgi:(p)ppGpp synthase/HD superfamily hydrolase
VTESLRERAAAMVERVSLECSAVLAPADLACIRAAVTAALRVRDETIASDHDPRYLHPARTVLILLADVACRDADVLAAAAFVESLPGPAPRADAAALTTRARALFTAVPLPDNAGDELLEQLVTAEPAVTCIAVAERLDHARHLHLMSDVPAASFHASIEAVYLPVAQRACPPLARRLERWARAFARRRRGTGPGQ